MVRVQCPWTRPLLADTLTLFSGHRPGILIYWSLP